MKVNIAVDERYPEYLIVDSVEFDTSTVEVDPETYKRWLDAIGEYNKVQSEIAKVITSQEDRK